MATSSGNASLSRWRWLLPVALVVALFHVTPAGPTLDRAFFDWASRHPLRPPPLDPQRSALVLIDGHTLSVARAEGYGLRWPFPRAAFAALIAALDRAGAERIVVDFTFLDPSEAAEQDALLAGVAAAARGVVLARTASQEPVFWDNDFVQTYREFFPTPRTGNADLIADADGVARRYDAGGSLASAALAVPTSDEAGLLRWQGGLDTLRARGVPVLSAARFFPSGLPLLTRLADQAPDADPAALARALAAEPELRGRGFDDVRGRVVFVGANASGTFDLKPLPVGKLEPGVLLHWTAWTNLVADGFIAPLSRHASLALAGGFLLALAAVGVRRGGLAAPVLVAVGLIAGSLSTAYAGLSGGWFLAPATPVFAAGLALTGVAAEGFWAERHRRREVQAMFGSYVAPSVVERLVRDPDAIRLGGERREATVFFCDLAGFTDLSEQVSPEELLALINSYLEETSDCLLAHGAYVDKYIGDAVMAVFGAPEPQADHAGAACRAALAVQAVFARLNARLAAERGRALHLRIGLNTGEMIVGNVGSSRKLNYTVLGDAVNLASRLEGANKEFGTAILVGEETARRVGDRLALRPLTRLRVKGRLQAVEVSELVGAPGELTPEQAAFLAAYRTAYVDFAARRFVTAAQGFARAVELAPRDRTARAHLAEAQRLAHAPPPAGWEPVLTLETK
ncbi:MAG TPA: adenylate/guanylate cyclase domain-containing protein [Opitutaceae bacterium]